MLNQEKTDSSSYERVPVQILIRQNFNREIISQGQIESKFYADVFFKLEAEVKFIGIKIGQRVKKGQVLAELDESELNHELEKLDQSIVKAQFGIEEKLISLGYTIGDTMINKELLDRLAVEFNLKSLEIDKKQVLFNLQQTTIKAPISGIISEIDAKMGNRASNYSKLCSIIDDSQLQVVFPVLEEEIELILPGSPIQFYPLYSPQNIGDGYISSIIPKVDEFGMIKCFAEVKRSQGKLFEGMKVKVFILNQIAKQLVIPKTAVVDRQGQQVVFTFKGRRAHWNYVKLGEENTQFYTVLAGLSAGDTIITHDNIYLAHFEKVEAFFEEK